MIKYIKVIVCILGIAFSTNSFALFDAQVLVGNRSAKFEAEGQSKNVNAIDYEVSAHLSPIPLVPVGLGLSYNYLTYNPGDNALNLDNVTGSELAAELYVWLPLPFIKPYVKAGYVFSGSYEMDILTGSAKYDTSGWYGTIGVRKRLIPFLKLLFEAKFPFMEFKNGEYKDIAIPPSEAVDYTTPWSIRIGLEVGI